jgi:DNA-binding transcriptional ArsR family regulator
MGNEIEVSAILKALANKRRLTILSFLKEKREASVSEIARHIRLSVRSTSRHLGRMDTVEILEKNQRGLFVFYKISFRMHICAKHILDII